MITDEQAMAEAINEAYNGINNGEGGPFGCVIVKNGVIVGRGHNRVVKNNDPTCHGEIEAIRDACKNLKTFDLSGSVLYTTAEACPMCLGAIMWANIKTVFRGCTIEDTNKIGFRDGKFYDFIKGKGDILQVQEVSRSACQKLFLDYEKDKGRVKY